MGIRNFLSAVPPWKCQTSAAKMPTCVTCLPGIEDGSVCLWGEGLGRSLGWWVEAKQGPMANSSYIWSCTDQGFCRCSSFYRNHHIFDCSPHWQLGHCAPHRVPGEGSICPEFQKIVASILWLQKPRKKKNPADLHVSKSVDRYVHFSRLFVLSLPSKAAAAAP